MKRSLFFLRELLTPAPEREKTEQRAVQIHTYHHKQKSTHIFKMISLNSLEKDKSN